MTYSVVNTERENHGSVDVAYVTIDITSLENAGNEPFDPGAVTGLDDAAEYGVAVRGAEDPTVQVAWDHVNEQLDVINVSDATDVTSTTDVGEVILKVEGK
jgi:hypothetical protein